MSNLISIQDMQTEFFRKDIVEINVGDRLHISGPSGSGKTQFLLSLFCLRKFKAKSLYVKDDLNLRDITAFIPQSPQLPDSTIQKIINYHLSDHRQLFENSWRDLMQLELDKKYSELSGGERQVLHILLLFYSDKPVLLFDESFSAMDVGIREKLVNFLIQNQRGRAYVFTHHFSELDFFKPNRVLQF